MKMDFRDNLIYSKRTAYGEQQVYRFSNGRGLAVLVRGYLKASIPDHYELSKIYFYGSKRTDWNLIGLDADIVESVIDVYNALEKIEEWGDGMKTTLTVEDFEYLKNMQTILDDNIKVKKKIDEKKWHYDLSTEHMIALKTEVGEVLQECQGVWKYWKDKTSDGEKILKECIDVLHFIILLENKRETSAEELVAMQNDLDYLKERNIKRVLLELSMTNHLGIMLSSILAVLDYFGYDRDDIMTAYKEKNEINHNRLKSGY